MPIIKQKMEEENTLEISAIKFKANYSYKSLLVSSRNCNLDGRFVWIKRIITVEKKTTKHEK